MGGLLGSYFRGVHWEEPPALRRIDADLAFYFHKQPLAGAFSVRWSGSVYAPESGLYRFGTRSRGSTFVEVGGDEVIANERSQSFVASDTQLEKGWNPIEIRYRKPDEFGAGVYLYWTRPDAARELVPPGFLRPPGPRGRIPELEDPPPIYLSASAASTSR